MTQVVCYVYTVSNFFNHNIQRAMPLIVGLNILNNKTPDTSCKIVLWSFLTTDAGAKLFRKHHSAFIFCIYDKSWISKEGLVHMRRPFYNARNHVMYSEVIHKSFVIRHGARANGRTP